MVHLWQHACHVCLNGWISASTDSTGGAEETGCVRALFPRETPHVASERGHPLAQFLERATN